MNINIPSSFIVPEELKTKYFLIRKLTTKDVYLDYMTIMSSIDIIKKTRGGSWPSKDLTIEDDLIDLGWHQREFEHKSSFVFTVFNPQNTECLGCFYFYPAGYRKKVDESYDVDVSFWVTQEAYDQGLYEILYKTIQEFLKQWPFKKPFWSNEIIPD
ncbi:GNAT family N-acetyltransferase [Candidatus Beckwithbacteria bacterium]|nr:GNAT family N-acetyltransferase [Candidatus Beckwithbacteria bacterium]